MKRLALAALTWLCLGGLAQAQGFGQRGGGIHLVCRGVAGRVAQALERQQHGAQLRVAVRAHVADQPAAEVLVFLGGGAQQGQGLGLGIGGRQVQLGLAEIGGHAVVLGLRDGVGATLDLDDLWPGFGYPNDLLGQLAVRRARVLDVPVRPVYGGEVSHLRPWHLPAFVALVARARWRRLVG